MRRSVLLLTPLLPLALWACEDGPNQTFAPATGNLFNNGDTPAMTDDAGAPLTANYGGQSKTEICSGAELQQQWGRMINEPIAPPYHMAGLDLSGGEKFPIMTIEEAEYGPLHPINADGTPNNSDTLTRLCQPTVEGAGANGGDVGGSLQVHWGNNSEVQLEWAIPTHKAYVTTLNPGYNGQMVWDYTPKTESDGSPGKKHSYVFQLGQRVQKDGKDFEIDWNGGTYAKQVDELYRGIVGHFTPDLYTDTPTDCKTNGTCLAYPPALIDGIHPLVGFRPAAFYFFFQDPAKNAGNLVWYAYAFAIKFPPYGLARTRLKMDKQGPTATIQIGNEIGTNKSCDMELGNSFQSLLDGCINVFDPQTNQTALNKVTGGLGHDDQNFTFNLVAVNQNYFPKELTLGGPRQFDVIHDGESPADKPQDNIAGTFGYDVRASGPILNDGFAVTSNGTTVYKKDYHGAGAIWREFGRMAHERLANDYAAAHPKPADAVYWPRQWHDSQCYFPVGVDSKAAPGGVAKGATCDMFDAHSCQQAHNHGLGCSWNGTACAGTLTAPASCAEIPYGLASAVKCGWGLPATNSCATQVPASCTGPGNCGTLTETACAATAGCLWDTNGNGTACNNYGDQASCTADVTHHCAWWKDSLSWRAPDGCTGLEAQVDNATPADTGGSSGPGDLFSQGGGLGGENAMKPGDPVNQFCNDPGALNYCGDNGDTSGLDSDLLGGSLKRTIQYLGHGDINDVPFEGRDLRYFFKYFTIAYAKYLTNDAAATANGVNDDNPSPVPDFHDQFVDLDYLIFDSYGGGAARSEYVNFNHAGETDDDGNVEDPTDVELKMLLIGSNFQATNFYRRLDREERALFRAMALDDSQPAWAFLKTNNTPEPSFWSIPGTNGKQKFNRVNANMFLSNIFGAPAIASIFSPTADDKGAPLPAPAGWVNDCARNDTAPVMDAYFCATYYDPTNPNAVNGFMPDCPLHAPTDDSGKPLTRENGKPLLADYCGAFYPTAFHIGSSDGLELDGDADLLTETRKVKYTHYANPYDPTTARSQIEALVPFKEAKEGVGFPVLNPANPTLDVFVETDQFEMTGQVMTPIIDYTETSNTDDAGTTHATAQIVAVETEDYLGEVFLCADTASAAARLGTGRPGDILSAHMYTSVQAILDWIASHPGSQDSCGLVIRYSPFNNYPDVIQSSVNGVRVNIEQGAGFGRVSDVTIFDTAYGTPAAP